MVKGPQIYTARVMHKRLFPKDNTFSYGVYYMALPLPAEKISSIWGTFDPHDVGYRDGRDPLGWVRDILSAQGLSEHVHTIILITMPKVLGYVFNPVSFYLCLDTQNALRAVVCEVHNTFGEQHSYLCFNANHHPLDSETWICGQKVFHVSPFLERNGTYRFRFDWQEDRLGVWIDYYDENDNKQLITALWGTFSPLTKKNWRLAFWRHPLVTLKAIVLIHRQALRLALYGIRYKPKPPQRPDTVSVCEGQKTDV
jgi:DUF1365 family protein